VWPIIVIFLPLSFSLLIFSNIRFFFVVYSIPAEVPIMRRLSPFFPPLSARPPTFSLFSPRLLRCQCPPFPPFRTEEDFLMTLWKEKDHFSRTFVKKVIKIPLPFLSLLPCKDCRRFFLVRKQSEMPRVRDLGDRSPLCSVQRTGHVLSFPSKMRRS